MEKATAMDVTSTESRIRSVVVLDDAVMVIATNLERLIHAFIIVSYVDWTYIAYFL
jgi:hypothetical protein